MIPMNATESFIRNQSEATDYLMRDGDLAVPGGRYGATTSECIEPAYLVAVICAREDGRATISTGELDYAMGLVVNSHDDVASLLREHADGLDTSNVRGLS